MDKMDRIVNRGYDITSSVTSLQHAFYCVHIIPSLYIHASTFRYNVNCLNYMSFQYHTELSIMLRFQYQFELRKVVASPIRLPLETLELDQL